jgi:hypothetical protein
VKKKINLKILPKKKDNNKKNGDEILKKNKKLKNDLK